MEQRGYRSRSGHRREEPRRERDLGRFRGRGQEDPTGDELTRRAAQRSDGRIVERTGCGERRPGCDVEPEVADPRRQKGLRGGPRILRVAPAVADEQPRERADDLPCDEEGQEVRGRDEHEHRRDEREHGGEQPRPVDRLGRGRVGHDRGGDQWDEDDHRPGEALDRQPQLDRWAPAVDRLRLAPRRPQPERDGHRERADGERPQHARARAHRDDDHRRQGGQEGQDRERHPFSRRSFSVMSARRTR